MGIVLHPETRDLHRFITVVLVLIVCVAGCSELFEVKRNISMNEQLPPPPTEDLPPLSRDELKGLFDYLGRPNPEPCTHTFTETSIFLVSQELPLEPTIKWLQFNGAGCDCEVIFNTDAQCGEWAGRIPFEEE